jgi:hypothetical protein
MGTPLAVLDSTDDCRELNMTGRRKTRRPERSLATDLAVGALAGVLATAATGGVDRLLDRHVRLRDRLRERLFRRASPHELAGPKVARFLKGRRLTRREERTAQLLFSVAYGAAWGTLYAGLRRRYPVAGRWLGLPFAFPFFTLCDGAIAPLLKLTPTPEKLPARINAKEIGNHVAWTAAAELVHRARPMLRA